MERANRQEAEEGGGAGGERSLIKRARGRSREKAVRG